MEAGQNLETSVFFKKTPPEATTREVARIATGGLILALVVTALQFVLQPVISNTFYLAGLLLSGTVTILLSLIAAAILPFESFPELAIWKYTPGPWRLRPVRKSGAEAASWPEAGTQSWAPQIPGLPEFGPTQDSIVIIGSGLAGLSAAASLHRVGIPTIILERESGPRQEGSAITMWPNAFRVFDALGVGDAIREDHPPLTRVEICVSSGAVLRSFGLDECPGAPHDARIVRRNAILRAIEAKIPQHCIKYGVKVSSVCSTPEGALVVLADGRELPCRAVVACDGVRSRIAQQLGLPPASYSGEVYYRGLATFPKGVPEPPGTLRMMWGQGTSRLGISTLSKNQCFWFITKSCPEGEQFDTDEGRRADALACVKGWGCHIEEAIRNTPPDKLSRNRIQDRWLVAGGAVGKGCVTVAGDALHPMTPTLGQGGCVALEDGVRLALVLQKAGGGATPLAKLSPAQLAAALREFERERTARVGPITKKSFNMAWMLQLPYPPTCWLRNTVVKPTEGGWL
eukprot:jgi/Botrbrau1/3514/Bobra.341_2s0042.2